MKRSVSQLGLLRGKTELNAFSLPYIWKGKVNCCQVWSAILPLWLYPSFLSDPFWMIHEAFRSMIGYFQFYLLFSWQHVWRDILLSSTADMYRIQSTNCPELIPVVSVIDSLNSHRSLLMAAAPVKNWSLGTSCFSWCEQLCCLQLITKWLHIFKHLTLAKILHHSFSLHERYWVELKLATFLWCRGLRWKMMLKKIVSSTQKISKSGSTMTNLLLETS